MVIFSMILNDFSAYVQAELRERIVAILVNDALSAFQIVFLGWWLPPFGQIAVGSKLTSLQ